MYITQWYYVYGHSSSAALHTVPHRPVSLCILVYSKDDPARKVDQTWFLWRSLRPTTTCSCSAGTARRASAATRATAPPSAGCSQPVYHIIKYWRKFGSQTYWMVKMTSIETVVTSKTSSTCVFQSLQIQTGLESNTTKMLFHFCIIWRRCS